MAKGIIPIPYTPTPPAASKPVTTTNGKRQASIAAKERKRTTSRKKITAPVVEEEDKKLPLAPMSSPTTGEDTPPKRSAKRARIAPSKSVKAENISTRNTIAVGEKDNKESPKFTSSEEEIPSPTTEGLARRHLAQWMNSPGGGMSTISLDVFRELAELRV